MTAEADHFQKGVEVYVDSSKIHLSRARVHLTTGTLIRSVAPQQNEEEVINAIEHHEREAERHQDLAIDHRHRANQQLDVHLERLLLPHVVRLVKL